MGKIELNLSKIVATISIANSFLQSMLRIVVRLWKKSAGTHGKDTKARLVTVSAVFARCVRDPSAYLCLSASIAQKEARQCVWKDAPGAQRSARPVDSSRNNMTTRINH